MGKFCFDMYISECIGTDARCSSYETTYRHSTVRGAAKVAEEVKKRKLPIAVAVIPKTIDVSDCWG